MNADRIIKIQDELSSRLSAIGRMVHTLHRKVIHNINLVTLDDQDKVDNLMKLLTNKRVVVLTQEELEKYYTKK